MPGPYDCLRNYDGDHWTFDCEPTLTDSQVVEFCREGHLLLRGVVPDEINRRTCDYLESKVKMNPSWIPEGMTNEDLERIRTTHAPSTILLEDWFVDHVLLNAPVSGAIRSLLGRDVGLPVLVSDHRCECPQEAQRWHHDADHVFGPELAEEPYRGVREVLDSPGRLPESIRGLCRRAARYAEMKRGALLADVSSRIRGLLALLVEPGLLTNRGARDYAIRLCLGKTGYDWTKRFKQVLVGQSQVKRSSG